MIHVTAPRGRASGAGRRAPARAARATRLAGRSSLTAERPPRRRPVGGPRRRLLDVDVGHGQLLGSLRQDTRVVNLERTNVARLERTLVPDHIDVVTMDLSYLSVARALAQLGGVNFAPGADLIALVKPMFELGLPAAPRDTALMDDAGNRAWQGAVDAGWDPRGLIRSPIEGAKGARELFLLAVRT